MIQTQWSQWNHYNALFPPDPSPGEGYGNRAPVGCMPVAAAQIASFYQWPPRGTGRHTDLDDNAANLIAGTFSGALDDTFDWPSMQPAYDAWSTEPAGHVAAVAELMYEMGVALELDFGSYTQGGSVCSIDAIGRSLSRSVFFERGSTVARAADPAAFDQRLREQVLAGVPVIASLPGHSVIVDGLAVDNGTERFHVNYGWGGINDGWYTPDNVTGAAFQSAVFDLRPALIPILRAPAITPDPHGSLSLAWDVPASRAAEVTSFRIREGRYVSGEFTDTFSTLDNWTDYTGGWTMDATGGNPCLRKFAELGTFPIALRYPVIPSASSLLSFRFKATLADDAVTLKASTDGGASWTVLRTLTGTSSGWSAASIDLSDFAGRETCLVIEYVFRGGRYHGQNGGLWVDDIRITGCELLSWSDLAADLPPVTRNFNVGSRPDGTYRFEVSAAHGPGQSLPSPLLSLSVAFDAAADADGDGLPNGWEVSLSGDVSSADPLADADHDGSCNRAEVVAGTDPLDMRSVLRLTAAAPSLPPRITWASVAGRTYSVLRSPGPAGPFIPVAAGVPATPPLNTFTDTLSLPYAFYRIEVVER